MNDTFLPGSGFDTYESQDKVLMQMDGSTEAAVAVRILQQQGFAVVGAVVRLAPEQAEAAQRAKKAAEALGIECILLNAEALAQQPGAAGAWPQFAALLTAAVALALGIGVQNFPEGAAIALPLRQEGLSAGRAFLYGSASGVVEPVFGILVVLVAGTIQPLMPWLLSFAAGAMMYVVVEELIPEAHLGEHSNTGTLGVMAGFLLMMVLDVALG